MPSPFPGMDPFVESQRWEDFHTRFITNLSDLLTEQVRPRYSVEIERYVYLVQESEGVEEVVRVIEPDVSIRPTGQSWRGAEGVGAALAVKPVRHRVPMPQRRQPFLIIRTPRHQRIVTVIELLSPTNKRRGPEQAEYITKRMNVLRSSSNLVELDLLRGGARLPTEDRLQPGDYYAFISRTDSRPVVDVFGWPLRDPLPAIPIPLAGDDPDVLLDLQAAFTATYERGGYDYSLDYRLPVEPPLADSDATWVAEIAARAAGQAS